MRLLAVLLLPLMLSTASATNTSEEVRLRVTLTDGTVLDGRVSFKKSKLEVKGRKTKKIAYDEVDSLSLIPVKSDEQLTASYERRKGRLTVDDPRAWKRLGSWARKQGLREKAREAYAKAVELDPEDDAARRGAGLLKGDDGEWAPGGPVLQVRRKALKADDHDGLVSLARLAFKSGLVEEGAECLQQVLLQNTFHTGAIRLVRKFTDPYRHKVQPLRLPVKGRWSASQDRTRHHQKKGYALYALDLLKLGPDGKHKKGNGKQLEDHYAWGAPFYAVADGKVVEVRDGNPDNQIGKSAGKAEQHNGVSVEHGNGEISWYIHAKNGSVKVKLGDEVKAGQLLGLVGNSGGTSVPHLHFTLVWRGISIPWACDDFQYVAPDGTVIPVTRAWPREGWTIDGGEEDSTEDEEK